RDENSFLRFKRAETDLHRKLSPVLAKTKQLQAGTHRAHTRIGQETGAASDVAAPQALRNDSLHRLIQQLLSTVPDQLFGLCIYQGTFTSLVDDHDRVRSRLEKSAKLLF